MAAGSINILFENRHGAVARWQQVIILAVREQLMAEAWDATRFAVDSLALESPACLFMLFGERTQLPDSETLAKAVRTLQGARAVCRARVVPGQGMRPSAVRYMLDKAEGAAQDTRPYGVFNTIPEATDWMGHTVSKDPSWRLSLGTVAGTLLYGTPSYTRRSQVSRYLAGDEVEPPVYGLDGPKRKPSS